MHFDDTHLIEKIKIRTEPVTHSVKKWCPVCFSMQDYLIGPYDQVRLNVTLKSTLYGGNCAGVGRYITDKTMILDTDYIKGWGKNSAKDVETYLRNKPHASGHRDQKTIEGIIFRYNDNAKISVTPFLCLKTYTGERVAYCYLTDGKDYNTAVVYAKKLTFLCKVLDYDTYRVARAKNNQKVLMLYKEQQPVGALAGLYVYPFIKGLKI